MAPKRITVTNAGGRERKIQLEEEGDLDNWLVKLGVESLINSEGYEVINFNSLTDGGKYTLGPQQRQQDDVDDLARGVDQINIQTEERSSSSMPDLFQPIQNSKPKDMLLSLLDTLEQNSFYTPFLVIVQSSGYGKTRSVLEVAKERRVVYLLCGDIMGGLQSPPVVTEFVRDITTANTTEFRERRATKFLKCVVQCAKQYETAPKLLGAQFRHASFGDFYDVLAKAVSEAETPPNSPIKSETDKATSSSSSTSVSPLVVVFDEALSLTGNESHNCDSPYRCIRRLLKLHGLTGIFLDTSGKLHHFTPEGAASDRETSIGMFPSPIFEIDTFDLFKDHVFFYGRPLWKMQWEYRLEKDYGRLVNFACHKLLPLRLLEQKDRLCTMFVCRFGLEPCKSLADKMVADHMATLVDVSENRKTVVTKYKSEPILAEAAAFITSYNGNYTSITVEEVLKEVSNNLSRSILKCDIGDRGKVAAAAWLGFSLDDIRKKQDYNAVTSNLSREVEAHEFLKVVFPEVSSQLANYKGFLQGWKVNFTHFCRLGFSPDRSIFDICWNRRAALYLPPGEEGIDMLITMRKETDAMTYATLRVQVKNYKNKITEASLDNMFQKLDVRRCAPRTKLKDEQFSVALVIQVGEGRMENVCKLATLGRKTRSARLQSSQLQLACTVSGDYCEGIRSVAGTSVDNENFIGSSYSFRDGEFPYSTDA